MIKKILNFVKEEYKFILINIFIIVLFLYPLPYYISAPGGLRDISTRLEIEERNLNKETFHITFLKEYKGRLPLIIYSFINKDYQLFKIDNPDYDYELDMQIGRYMFEDAFDNAIESAYKLANKEYTVVNNKILVIYGIEDILDKVKTGDQILKIDEKFLSTSSELSEYISTKKIGDKVTLEILRDGKLILVDTNLIDIEGEPRLGLSLMDDRNFLINPDIKTDSKSKEVGPSGGLMSSLYIYYELMQEKIDLKIAGTGTIDSSGNVGNIGGMDLKVITASKNKVDIFFVPSGEQYEEAMKVNKKRKFNLNIVPVSTLEEAVNYTKTYKK